MKTSEFIRRAGLRYRVISANYGHAIKVVDAFYDEVAIISCLKSSDIFLFTKDIELAKLCLEYAETPISEREDEKKYIVILPDPRNDGTHCQALYKGLYGICIGYVYRYDLQSFTEAEIKRNHEYLWQFAKEAQE